MSLPELLQEAEEEELNRSATMSPRKHTPFLPHASFEPSTVATQRRESEPAPLPAQSLPTLPSGWCRDDWKNMERAFVRERRIIAQRHGLKSSSQVEPSSVDLDDVVDRFVTSKEISTRSRVGPDFERYGLAFVMSWCSCLRLSFRQTLLLRAAALQRRLVRLALNTRYVTPTTDPKPMIPETPSTFGDDFDYDRCSRQSSMTRSASAQPLPPSLQAPHYAHLHNEANTSRSMTRNSHPSFSPRNGPKDPLPVTSTVREEQATSASSMTSRLLSYVKLGRSSTPPHSNPVPETAPDVFKVPREPTSSSNTDTVRLGIGPDTVQTRHNGPITLPEPLRRASNVPIRDLSVRLSREYEEFPELRHVDPPSRPSTTSPPSKRLRAVSSTGSVKDLVKGFEDLTQETEGEMMKIMPRSSRVASLPNQASSGRPRSVSQISVKSSSSVDLTGSSGRNNSFDMPGVPKVEDAFGHSQWRHDIHSASFSIPSMTADSIDFLRSSASAEAAVMLPKQKHIPGTAPPKRRLSFFSWM